jgi:hypothetical protein
LPRGQNDFIETFRSSQLSGAAFRLPGKGCAPSNEKGDDPEAGRARLGEILIEEMQSDGIEAAGEPRHQLWPMSLINGDSDGPAGNSG